MRRLVALVLVLVVAVSSAVLTPVHVHAYGDHEHREHQHGPASHDHDQGHGHGHSDAPPARSDHDHDYDQHHAAAPREHGGNSRRLDACDPGSHTITVPTACAPLPPMAHHLAVLPGPVIVAPPAPERWAIAITDVRVHGPPAGGHIPARAPPLTSLA